MWWVGGVVVSGVVGLSEGELLKERIESIK